MAGWVAGDAAAVIAADIEVEGRFTPNMVASFAIIVGKSKATSFVGLTNGAGGFCTGCTVNIKPESDVASILTTGSGVVVDVDISITSIQFKLVNL